MTKEALVFMVSSGQAFDPDHWEDLDTAIELYQDETEFLIHLYNAMVQKYSYACGTKIKEILFPSILKATIENGKIVSLYDGTEKLSDEHKELIKLDNYFSSQEGQMISKYSTNFPEQTFEVDLQKANNGYYGIEPTSWQFIVAKLKQLVS